MDISYICLNCVRGVQANEYPSLRSVNTNGCAIQYGNYRWKIIV